MVLGDPSGFAEAYNQSWDAPLGFAEAYNQSWDAPSGFAEAYNQSWEILQVLQRHIISHGMLLQVL